MKPFIVVYVDVDKNYIDKFRHSVFEVDFQIIASF